MRIRRVFAGMFAGSTCLMAENSSARVAVAGKGRHSVEGRERPGKVLSRMLTTESMLQQPTARNLGTCEPGN